MCHFVSAAVAFDTGLYRQRAYGNCHAHMQALRTATRCSHIRKACIISLSIISSRRQVLARQRSCSTANAVFIAPTEEHLQHLASRLARTREAGDCYLLYGSVGAGKSAFSRAFIRAAADDPQLPVPSPTYLLQLVYAEQEGPPIHHFDLYRLELEQDMSRLELTSSFSSTVSLVEWAERLPEQLVPAQRLEVRIQVVNDQITEAITSCSRSKDSRWQQQVQQVQQRCLQQIKCRQHRQDMLGQAALLLPTPVLQDAAAATQDSYLLGDVNEIDDGGFKEDELFTDQQWRSVELTAVGDRWVARLLQLSKELHQQQQQPVTGAQ